MSWRSSSVISSSDASRKVSLICLVVDASSTFLQDSPFPSVVSSTPGAAAVVVAAAEEEEVEMAVVPASSASFLGRPRGRLRFAPVSDEVRNLKFGTDGSLGAASL